MYSQTTKNKARNTVINSAVERLTKERRSSTLANREYVRAAKHHILNSDNPSDAQYAKLLTDETISRWEKFYDTVIQSKDASTLKVAYLSGPNPENDLKVFCEAGILPENIWAFESDKSIYLDAVKSALNSEFPFIKIINGGIDSFIEASPQRFDIIYLDFCGPLPNRNKKQKTLGTITKILGCHSLNSPGVLITNVSLPTQYQDAKGRELISKLVANYLYPKQFLESGELEENFIEGAVAHSMNFDEWSKKVASDLDNYYGQFITRLIVDMASFISPYDRFPRNNAIFGKFFNISDKSSFSDIISRLFHFDDEYGGGDVIVDSGQFPVLWALAALDKATNGKDSNYPDLIYNDASFSNFASSFTSQLGVKGSTKELIDNISAMSFLLSQGAGQEHFLSESIRNIYDNHNIHGYYQFCDLVLFHQIIELLFRQVSVPYHVNIKKTERWKYTAKETPMFMDMIVFDECRYLYDWMPTSDMISAGISDLQRQLSYRFVLDGVAKHRRWYNPEYFFGTAVIDQFSDGFEAKTLSPRKAIE